MESIKQPGGHNEGIALYECKCRVSQRFHKLNHKNKLPPRPTPRQKQKKGGSKNI